ncbi:hypothetical protein [Xenorhabdus eapokensis]|uniref:Lipoprotein n=1 Tax=Xenorhabdus eapokensis TaxID=1873482 RepID=A0A1Q5TGZ3_9GAMM|nr:hypothetical protein [Xenorhabdus eapokensis]OKO99494.1 exported hypothetical protein [Xenorhabdus eapokensis]
MSRILIVVICGLSLVACKPTEKDFINIGESLVRNSLKDPDSAKFDSFYRPSGESDGYVCGMVNAKNSYGGYIGKKTYYVYIETKDGKLKHHGPIVIENDDDQAVLDNFRLLCQREI